MNRAKQLWAAGKPQDDIAPRITAFQRFCDRRDLYTNSEKLASEALRRWCERYRLDKYIPESLLAALMLTVNEREIDELLGVGGRRS